MKNTFSEKVKLQGIPAEHSIDIYSKTKQKPSYQALTTQASREKESQEQAKEYEIPRVTLLGAVQNSKLYNHNIYAEDFAPTHTGSMGVSLVSLGFYGPSLVDSVCIFPVMTTTTQTIMEEMLN